MNRPGVGEGAGESAPGRGKICGKLQHAGDEIGAAKKKEKERPPFHPSLGREKRRQGWGNLPPGGIADSPHRSEGKVGFAGNLLHGGAFQIDSDGGGAAEELPLCFGGEDRGAPRHQSPLPHPLRLPDRRGARSFSLPENFPANDEIPRADLRVKTAADADNGQCAGPPADKSPGGRPRPPLPPPRRQKKDVFSLRKDGAKRWEAVQGPPSPLEDRSSFGGQGRDDPEKPIFHGGARRSPGGLGRRISSSRRRAPPRRRRYAPSAHTGKYWL